MSESRFTLSVNRCNRVKLTSSFLTLACGKQDSWEEVTSLSLVKSNIEMGRQKEDGTESMKSVVGH